MADGRVSALTLRKHRLCTQRDRKERILFPMVLFLVHRSARLSLRGLNLGKVTPLQA